MSQSSDVDGVDFTQETRKQFEERYAASVYGVAFGANTLSLPCTCEDGGGPTHWAAVSNNPVAIKAHVLHEALLKQLREEEAANLVKGEDV